jgi:hypothetical protein
VTLLLIRCRCPLLLLVLLPLLSLLLCILRLVVLCVCAGERESINRGKKTQMMIM